MSFPQRHCLTCRIVFSDTFDFAADDCLGKPVFESTAGCLPLLLGVFVDPKTDLPTKKIFVLLLLYGFVYLMHTFSIPNTTLTKNLFDLVL